ncbi:Uncharacterised protein [Bordetella pertussis]|nr:Uncharacterised protein [Bordetella pertussis]
MNIQPSLARRSSWGVRSRPPRLPTYCAPRLSCRMITRLSGLSRRTVAVCLCRLG